LLVSDDGSEDSSREIAAAVARDDYRVRLLARPRDGIVAALNAGIEAAQGELLARMDADDEALPTRLAEQVGWLDAHSEVGLVSCLVEFGGDRVANAGYALHVDWINSLRTAEEIALNRFIESPLAHPTVMFRREVVRAHGGYRDGNFPEDYELWLRWLDGGVRIEKVPRTLLRWHDTASRLSRRDPRYDVERFYEVKAHWIARELERRGARRTGRDAAADHPGSRKLYVWGAGRPTRKRAGYLAAQGVTIDGYIDIDRKKSTPAIGGTGAPVILPAQIPPPSEVFVLGYVSSRGARELIRGELTARGFKEGRDFLMCA
jgi:glycosyltransferase involved in cell wall biosynthesis